MVRRDWGFRSGAQAACLGLLCMGVAPAASAQEGGVAEARRVIEVVGSGQRTASPDTARIYIGVTARGDEADAALESMSASVTSVLAVLEEQGVDMADVQTAQLSLDQTLDHSAGEEPQPAGFVATSNLSVTLRDIDVLGEVLDAVVAGGANRIGRISFAISDSQALLDAARADAVAEARRRAEVLAQAAGVSLGDIVRIAETSSYSPPSFAIEQAPRAAAVATGSVALEAGVSVTFEILD